MAYEFVLAPAHGVYLSEKTEELDITATNALHSRYVFAPDGGNLNPWLVQAMIDTDQDQLIPLAPPNDTPGLSYVQGQWAVVLLRWDGVGGSPDFSGLQTTIQNVFNQWSP